MFGAATNAAPTGQQQQQPVTSAAPDTTTATTANAGNMQATGNNNNSSSTWAFHAKLRLAVDQGVVSEALADEIRVRFAAPFDISGVSVAQAPGNSNTGITNAATAVAGGGVAWLSLATQQSRATETRQKDLDARHVVVAMELLNLLLMCDSGYYNSESNTTTATTGEVTGEESGVRGLHAAVATIARSASSNIVQYLRKELTSSSLGAESLTTLVQRHAVPLVAERSSGLSLVAGRHAAMDGLSAAQQEQESRMWHLHGIGHNPIILSAQCLYLLTRHFQLQASSVKELLELVELLLLQLPYENSPLHNTAAVGSLNFSRGKALRALCQTPATAATSALLWLVVFATVNTVAVWKKLRGANGELAHNVLLHSDVAALLAESTRNIRQKVDAMEEQQQQHHHHSTGRPSATMTDPYSFLSPHAAQTRLLRTPGTRTSYGNNNAEPSPGGQANRTSGALLQQQQQVLAASATAVAHRPWLDALAGFVSVLTLAEGCLLRAKGDERGYDRALEAFIGDRSRGSTGSAATATTSNTAVLPYASPWRGTVAQRMVQLAPITEALRIPAEYVYIAPYEMLSYVFDSLVPVLRRLAELELASYRRYIDQMQLNEPLMMMTGGGGVTNDMTDSATGTLTGWRNNNCNNTSGGYLLANGITRDGSDATLERRAMRVIEEPFTTYMAPILAALATCLSELPSEVLNPDLDSDCAATFFIFRNCARHLVHVFAVQQQDGAGSSQWQDFTLKTVTQFLNVLTMIGRHAQYLPRLIAMLSGTQAACPELHWGSLMAQAIECAGLNMTTTTTTTSNTESRAAVAVGPGRHRQFTVAYSRRRRQEYLASCFLLLRQLVTSRALRGIVNDYLSLDAALAFLAAPRQSQGTLGSTLSLLAALIASAEDAARVFDFLTVHKLLLPSSQAASETSSSSRRLLLGSERGTGTRGEGAGSEETTNLSLIGHARYEGTQGRYPITIGLLHLLIALCRYDIVHGSAATLTGYTALVDFVAQEVLRGVSRRLFLEERERWSVMALAAAALRQALLVRFVATPPEALSTTNYNNSRDIGAVAGAIPLTVVMATNKAPNDILGELLQCIYRASIAPYDLGSLERAALRQCLRLLNVALHVLAAQQLEIFAFEARTVQSESLAYHLLLLCGMGHDEALLASCLELLLLLPAATVTQAARQLHAMPQRLAAITGRLATLLQPGSLPAPVIRAPPELAFLDTELDDTATCWQDTEDNNNRDTSGEVTSDELRSMRTSYTTTTAVLSVSHKALLLDLLIQHACMAAPSLTLLLCGFYDAAMTHGDGRVEMCNRNAWNNMNDNSAMALGRQDETSNGNTQGRKGNALFASVLDGVMSRDVEHDAPALAVKYVKLLYLLRANVRYGTSLIRPSMERGSQHLFFQLQHFAPSLPALKQRHEPLLLCRYAYILRLLALETVHTARSSAAQLSLRHGGVPRVSVEVLLSLLLPSSSSTTTLGNDETLLSRRAQGMEEQNTNNNEPMALLSRSDAADLAQWLTQVLHSLPVFPSYELPPSVRHGTSAQACYTVLAADGVVQLDLVAILEALQRAQAQRQLPPLSFNDLRERLRPFVVANDCLMHYAAVTSFVEAWCQLVGVACGVVRHLPQSRLRTLAQNILAGVALTRGMTAAAQERVVRRLFFTLSSVLAHLLRRVQEEIDEDEEEDEEEGGIDNTDAQQGILSNTTAAALQQRQLRPRRQHRRRRLREEYEDAVSGQTYCDESAQVRIWGWRRGVSNQCLLRPLLTAVVQWGTTLPSARVDLYNSLFCWIMIPGVEIEDIVLYRTQEALLRLLAQDISCTSDEGNVNGAALRWSATTLLIRLLTRSSTLSDAFGKLGLDTHSPLAVQCGMALLSTTSQAMSAHFAGSADAALVLDAIQNCFDFLCAIALRHGGKLALCGPLLATCLSLDVWTHGTQVMLGTSMNIRHTAAASSSFSSATTLTSSQLVWCGFLRGVLRWLNVILMNSGYANNLMVMMESENECPPLLAQLRDFVAARRQLLETALHMPLLVPTSTSTSVSPVVVLDHTTLSLCAEFVRLLRGLASANGTLAVACRTLVHEMNLPELLHSLCTLPMSDMTVPALNTTTIATSASQRLSLRNATGGTLHSSTPMTLISIVTLATAVRDTAHLLLRAECAGLYDAGNELTPMTHLPGQSDNDANKSGPLIRDNAAHVECIVHATEALTVRVQGVRRAYTTQPSAELVLSYESYLLALQALVCLIHSLVLPLKHTRNAIPSNASSMASHIVDQNSKVRSYLSCLPLAAMDAVLRQVQQMVSEGSDDALYLLSSTSSQMTGTAGGYASRDCNAGRAYLTPATEETVVAAAMRAAQHQDKSTRPSRRRAEDVNTTTIVTPRQTSSGPAAAESVMREASLPATPLIHPADGTRLMGTRPAIQQQQQSSTSATQRGAASETRRMSVGVDGAMPLSSQPPQPHSLTQSESSGPAADPDTTLGDLLASTTGATTAAAEATRRATATRSSTSASRCPSVMESIETNNNGGGVALRPDAAESHARLPHLVRQVRIAVANALRATQSAMAKVSE